MSPANDIEFAGVVQGNVVATSLRFLAARYSLLCSISHLRLAKTLIQTHGLMIQVQEALRAPELRMAATRTAMSWIQR